MFIVQFILSVRLCRYLRRRRDYVPPDALSQTGSYSVRGERRFHKFGPPIYVEKAHISVLVSEDACMGEKHFRGHHLTLSLTSFVILSLVKEFRTVPERTLVNS